MAINDTLSDVGNGVGALFTGMGEPLMTFLILLGIATGVIGIFMAIAYRIKSAV